MFLTVVASAESTSTIIEPKPQVTISVYDYAHIPTGLLSAAEEDAQRVFRKAGVETVWTTCLPKPEKAKSDSCDAVDANHLVLKVLPHAIAANVRDRGDVLGSAILDDKGLGFYAHVFYDRVQRVAEERKLGHALLGDVLAHEIGHLLLGSNSHSVSGIMSAHWNGEELRRISEGSMFFAANQARMIRDRIASRKIHVPAVAARREMGSDMASTTGPPLGLTRIAQ